MFHELYQFVKKAKTSQQFGFMERSSSSSQIPDFVMDAYRCIDKKKINYALYVDFVKAFNKVSHAILPKKLHRFRVCGHLLHFFRSNQSESSNV